MRRKARAKRSFETFREIGSWEIQSLKWDAPSCFNRDVRFRKCRVTIEPVEEPIEVLQERVRQLWRECHNHHNWDALQAAATEVGIKLDPDQRATEPEK